MNNPIFGNLPDDAELRLLVAARCDGTIDDKQAERLDALIVGSPQAAEFYVAYLAMHANLPYVLGKPPAQPLVLPAGVQAGSRYSTETASEQRITAASRGPSRARRFRTAFGAAGAVALLALVLLGLQATTWFSRPASKSPVVAWVDAAHADDAPRGLRSGDRIRQAAGQATVRFNSGVSLKLSGDADLELISAMSVRLYSGQLQADVGETGRGFRVLTDSTDVVDLGTVFGVGVKPSGETDVVVFQGEVELSRREGSSQVTADHRYTTGEAVRVESGGDRTRIPVIWQAAAGGPWSTEAATPSESVIASVSDNLSTDSRPKFYSVVPRGFRSGVKAYADRNHTWIGGGAREIPRQLVGGDYIQTFIDDRMEKGIEINLTLARSARVYILIDDRVAPPDWIERDFTNTGLKVALRCAHTPHPDDLYRIAEGQVHPISHGLLTSQGWEFSFSIWMCPATADQELRLWSHGTPYLGDVTRSCMYGIVVVPQSEIQ